MVADCPQVFYVHPSVPAKTMKELIALAKANPGKYSFATGGTGTLAHLCGELLKLAYGLDIPHVPHRSAGPAIQSTLGGHVPVGVNSLPSSKGLMQTGELRGLGITSATRFPSTPELPTMTEQGITGLEASNWQAFMVPAGAPQPLVNFLYREISKIVKDLGMRDRFIELGFTAIDTTPAQLAQRIKSELRKWEKVIRDAKIEAQ
jgi:tripartite-type tricarboxylate transporter receptor subunit TctC